MIGERIACLTLDLEPDLHDAAGRVRLLDDDARLEGFARFLGQHDIPLTIFTLMSLAPKYADRLNDLARRTPIEFAVHSYSHDTNNPASADEARRGWETFGAVWNAAPLGYRAPNCLIDERGIDILARQGFYYDSSIVPALRPDKFGYNNLHYGRDPFIFHGPSGDIVELPVACLRGLRLPFILSYIKLLGWPAFRAAIEAFPLPDTVVTYFHPYDLYVDDVAAAIPGWKRYAHMRNARRSTAILAAIIRFLKGRGYRFALMRDVAAAHRPR